jgi:hypothetical protein
MIDSLCLGPRKGCPGLVSAGLLDHFNPSFEIGEALL